MPLCERCASEVPPGSHFCPNCGTAVPASPEAPTVTMAPPPAARLSTSTPDEGRFPLGTVLAQRYRILGRLGKGGMGEVYKATDLLLGQTVALKFLPESVAANAPALDRFRNEVRLARQVSHPNVCRVYDIGEVEGAPFLTMEYVDGEDLASLLRRIGRLPPDKALDIARRLCAGLAAAHDKGVLHRDLKPGNIMIDGRGEVLITDFGLAAVAGGPEAAQVRQGTPAYMAPEQLAGREVTLKSDLYALGLVLYEIFTGKRAFEAASLAELARMQQECTPPGLTTIAKEVDPAVERAVLRCLAPDPRQRPASAKAVALALPGGDPLAAAVAAGETPSPDMVAAGEAEGLRPAVAVAMVVAVIAGLIAIAALSTGLNLIEKTPFENSPDVLAGRARDHAKRLGYPEKPADSARGMTYARDYLEYARTHYPAATRWSHLGAGRPAPVTFWYRQSPRVLVPVFPGRVTRAQPPFDVSGMLRMRLDMQGRLLEFEAVPPQVERDAAPPAPPDWTALFAAAGLDPARLTPAQPQWTPLVACDARAAWTGAWPEAPEIPIRIEAAAWRGKPVSFNVIEPWRRPERAEVQPDQRRLAVGIIGAVVILLVVPLACLLARRNLKLNRGDRRGATRLALVLLSVCMLYGLLWMSHVADFGEVGMLVVGTAISLFIAATAWVLYLALEPYARRRWPQMLVCWTRVLAGRFRDPQVGAHVLAGVLVGIGLRLVQLTGTFIEVRLGAAGSRSPLDNLLGARELAAYLLDQSQRTLGNTLVFLFLLFVLRVLLRRDWLAAAAFTLIGMAMGLGADIRAIGVPISAIFFLAVPLVLLRFGLLALIATLMAEGFLEHSALTLDTSRWYFGHSLVVLLVVAALAAWAFHTTLAGRPLLKDETLDG